MYSITTLYHTLMLRNFSNKFQFYIVNSLHTTFSTFAINTAIVSIGNQFCFRDFNLEFRDRAELSNFTA